MALDALAMAVLAKDSKKWKQKDYYHLCNWKRQPGDKPLASIKGMEAWKKESADTGAYYEKYGDRLPAGMKKELEALQKRLG